MDTGKLLKIIADIKEEEAKGKIQARLQNIADFLTQDDPASVNAERDSIKNSVISSRLGEYATSDFHALEQLGVSHLFGPGLYQSLEEVLNSQTHEVRVKLSELITEREQKMNALVQAGTSLGVLDFKSRKLNNDEYEIGFVLPDAYSEMIRTEKAIRDLRIFLDALADATGHPQSHQIKYVSNGTIELFITAGLELVENFASVVSTLVEIYGIIQLFNDGARRYDNFTSAGKKKAVALNEQEKQKQVDDKVNGLINSLGIETVEKQGRVRGLFVSLLKHVENGVGLEVRTPDTKEPTEPPVDSDDDEVSNYQQQLERYKAKKAIDANNREIFMLQKNNFYGMDTKFLQPPDDVDV